MRRRSYNIQKINGYEGLLRDSVSEVKPGCQNCIFLNARFIGNLAVGIHEAAAVRTRRGKIKGFNPEMEQDALYKAERDITQIVTHCGGPFTNQEDVEIKGVIIEASYAGDPERMKAEFKRMLMNSVECDLLRQNQQL